MTGVTKMAVSGNNRHIALYSDSGYLYLGSVNLKEKYCECPTNMKEPLTDMAWFVCLPYFFKEI